MSKKRDIVDNAVAKSGLAVKIWDLLAGSLSFQGRGGGGKGEKLQAVLHRKGEPIRQRSEIQIDGKEKTRGLGGFQRRRHGGELKRGED